MPANPYPAVPCFRVFHTGFQSTKLWSALPSLMFTKPYHVGEWAEYDAMFVFTDQTIAIESAQTRFGSGTFEVWECEAEVRTNGGRYRLRYMRDQALYPLRSASIVDPSRLTPELHARWLRWTWHATDEAPSEYGQGLRVLVLPRVKLCDRLKPLRHITTIETER